MSAEDAHALARLHERFQDADYHFYYLHGCDGILHGTNDDMMGLRRAGSLWEVAYWERGKTFDERTFEDLDSAIAAFEAEVSTRRHPHFVAMSRDRDKIAAAAARLDAAGIVYYRNDITNFQEIGDTIYRFYVDGPAIFEVERAFGTRRLVDEMPSWTRAS